MRNKLKGLRLLIALLAVFGLLAAACGDDDGGDDASGDDASGESEESDECTGEDDAEFTVGMVYDVGGRGDKSFNDSAYAGLQQACEELGVKVEVLEPAAGGEDREELLRLLADQGLDLVIGVGFLFTDSMTTVAGEFPDTQFAIVDGFVEADNVTSIGFAEEQGSFLVGAAAAMKSETGNIGFIGGMEIDLIGKFEAGYIAGAMSVNPDIEVQTEYISQPPDDSGFNDPARAKEIANGMYGNGADIIYQAAGGSGQGVFEAADETGDVWAIGVDSDQYNTVDAPLNEVILTSMLKRVDVGVFETISAFVDGDDISGPQTYDLSVDGVGYSTSGGFIDDITGDLDDLKQQIIDGDIEVPTAP